jgi:hypothetical protein
VPDGHAVRVDAARVVRAHEVRAGDEVKLAAALPQDDLDVAEGLETRAEAGARLACAVRAATKPV